MVKTIPYAWLQAIKAQVCTGIFSHHSLNRFLTRPIGILSPLLRILLLWLRPSKILQVVISDPSVILTLLSLFISEHQHPSNPSQHLHACKNNSVSLNCKNNWMSLNSLDFLKAYWSHLHQCLHSWQTSLLCRVGCDEDWGLKLRMTTISHTLDLKMCRPRWQILLFLCG